MTCSSHRSGLFGVTTAHIWLVGRASGVAQLSHYARTPDSSGIHRARVSTSLSYFLHSTLHKISSSTSIYQYSASKTMAYFHRRRGRHRGFMGNAHDYLDEEWVVPDHQCPPRCMQPRFTPGRLACRGCLCGLCDFMRGDFRDAVNTTLVFSVVT